MKEKFLAAVGGVLALAPQIAQACSVCIDGTNDPTMDGYNASVFFLLATPYLVVGSIGGGLYMVYRRAMAKRAREQPEEAIVPLGLSQEESGR